MENDAYNMGGGAMATEGCRPIFRRVRFLRNTAHTGGAMAIGAQAQALAEDCLAEENVTVGIGGAFQVHDGGELLLRRCVARGNLSGEGGGIGVGGGRIEAEACTLLTNRGSFGGAVSVISGAGILRACLVRGNQADYFGGAVMCTSGDLRLEATWADSNRAAQGGGAVYAFDSTVELVNSLITASDAGAAPDASGGALCCRASAAMLDGCTLAANCGFPGSGMWLSEMSSATLDRCLVALGQGGAAVDGDASSTAGASCCDLWGNEGGDWVGLVSGQDEWSGNICADPLFCAEHGTDKPWSITPASPCAPAQTGACGLIGALGVGCGPVVAPEAGEVPGSAIPQPSVLPLPNPSAGDTRFILHLPAAGGCSVSLTVHDVAGRLVRRLTGRLGREGTGKIAWDGRDAAGDLVPRGVYWVRAVTGVHPADERAVRGAARVVRW